MIVVIVSFCVGLLLGTNIDSQAYVVTNDKVITLEQDTGIMLNNWWEGNFIKAAKYHCGEYEVLEKSETPKTLKSEQIKKNHYYWVVKCLQKENN